MSLMRNPKKVMLGVAAFVACLLLTFATTCHGEEVLFSVGSPVSRGMTPAVDLSWRFDSKTDAYWQTSLTLVGESTYSGEYQSNNAGLQVLYVDGFGPVDLGIGVAFLQNTDRYNGSHANFTLQFGYNWRQLYVQYRHWSNAGTIKPNLGRDLLFVGWRF